MLELSIDRNVATLTLCRPPVNAISDEWGDAFELQLDALEGRDDWTVLHLRSAQKVFAAGADLAQIHSWTSDAAPAARLAAYIGRLQRAFDRLQKLPRVTLAEIGGAALGGGMELALSCDLRMAAFEARLGLPEVGLGLIPALGGTQRLTRLAGAGVASRLILGAELVDGRTALELGLVQWAVAREALPQAAAELALRIAALPRPALAVAKELIAAAGTQDQRGFALERHAGGQLLNTAEAQKLIGAFVQKSARPS
ncbi:MAG: enoyl-CoA hydratase [Ramlibacter sp.]|jgi:enoyl-CoA hydratase/carnithine racemase|nr:enoyl-CoA hydratase [Ramlibacter sp.]